MVLIPVLCPHCQSDQVIKGGKTETGKQRYRCQQTDCSHRSFVLEPAYTGRLPHIKDQIIDMALNGSGIRDTARVLKISPTTVINELKKRFCRLGPPFVMEETRWEFLRKSVDPQQCKPPSARLVRPNSGRGRHSTC